MEKLVFVVRYEVGKKASGFRAIYEVVTMRPDAGCETYWDGDNGASQRPRRSDAS